MSTLGTGGFGQVLLVEYAGSHYALKCMKKEFVVDQGLVEHVKRERVSGTGEWTYWGVGMRGT